MKRWTKPIALVVAGMFGMTQAGPLAYAHEFLRPTATSAAPDARERLGQDVLAGRIEAALAEHARMAGATQATTYTVTIGSHLVDRAIPAIQAGLSEAIREEKISDFRIEPSGESAISLTVGYPAPDPSAEVARLVVDVVRGAVEPLLLPVSGGVDVPALDILAQRITPVAGAQTGQVHLDAALSAGATGVLAGHSETRPGSPTPIVDSNEQINAQVRAAAEQPDVRTIILAVGETTEAIDQDGQRRRDRVLQTQVREALRGLTTEPLEGRLIVAYEPRWAIGTRPATPAYAQSAHQVIRQTLSRLFGAEFAQRVRIIYGGSATAQNAAEFLAQDDIDGLLPGGASTSTARFVPIIEAAMKVAAEKKARTGRTLYIAGNQKTYPVDEAPEAFAAALGSVDPTLLQIGIAPTLTALSAWRTAFDAVAGAGGGAGAGAGVGAAGPGVLEVRPDILAATPELFGDKTVNGQTVNVEQTITELTRALGPEIASALTARRELLESNAPVREKYAWPDWKDTFQDGEGNERTFREIVQGLIDNFLGQKTPLRWRLNDDVPLPDDVDPLKNPGLELTGPWHPLNMAMNQLNADVAATMGDDEEDASAGWQRPFGAPADEPVGVWEQRRNVKQILAGEWGDGTEPREFRVTRRGQDRVYTIQKDRNEWPTHFHRVPGIHLHDPSVTVDGKPVPSIALSHVIHALNNYGSLKQAGTGAYYYEPKAQTPPEALIVEKLLRRLEGLLDVPAGTIKIAMLYEEGMAGRYLPAILWVWRDRVGKVSVGRWDYLGSLIEMWKDEAVFPDPQSIGMGSPSMVSYQRYANLIMLMAGMKDGEQTNGAAIGGMAAVMIYPQDDPYGRWQYNPLALRAIKIDKLGERLLGLAFIPDEPLPAGQQVTLDDILTEKVKGQLFDSTRQSWVASPEAAYVAAGNAPLRADVEDLQAMIDAPTETTEIKGKPVPTVPSGLIPVERASMQARGVLNQDGKITPRVMTKDMFDTPEKIFTQELWESIYGVPKGDITLERIQHAFYMAANYGFQILNGNYAAAIDDYELFLRFMNDLATYRIDVSWLWTVLHHHAAVTKDGYLKAPALTKDGVIPAVNAEEVKAGTPFTPELFEELWEYHNEWTRAFFEEQDRLAEQDPRRAPRFDRSKAPIIMDILWRQLLAPRYIQHSARVLFAVAEADDEDRERILQAIFSPSREDVVRQVEAGTLKASDLAAHDYVYDIFPEAEGQPAGRPRDRSPLGGPSYLEQVEAFEITTTPEASLSLRQGLWVPQVPTALNYVISEEVARAAADLSTPRWIVMHSSTFTDGPDAALILKRTIQQLRRVVHGGESAIKFALVVEGASSTEEAEAIAAALFQALPEASAQTTQLMREDVELVLPETMGGDELFSRLTAAVPTAEIGMVSLVGPATWTQAVQEASTDVGVAVFQFEPTKHEGQMAVGSHAVLAAVEAAAGGGRLAPEVVAKLDLSTEGPGVFAPRPLDVVAEVQEAIRTYRTTMRAAIEKV